MSDYLWDKSGPADPELERLEELLRQFRYRAPGHRPRRTIAFTVAGVAASVAIAVGAWAFVEARSEAWAVSVEKPEAAPRSIHLHSGETLETAPGETAHLSMLHVGRVDMEPQSTLRIVSSRSNQQRFELLRGTLHAHIGAPPRVFVVKTASATATDLGCAYTLHVDPSGDGFLHVTSGLIEFDWSTHRSFVPTGATALTRAGRGPGTPFFEDAPPQFREALQWFDANHRGDALSAVLACARPREAMSLLNLLQTVDPPRRVVVVSRLAQLSPPPAGVDISAVEEGRFESLELWWNALGLRHHPAVRLF